MLRAVQQRQVPAEQRGFGTAEDAAARVTTGDLATAGDMRYCQIAWISRRRAEDGELLAKSDILESQLATSLEGRDESGNQRRNHAGMVLADRRLIKLGARG